MDLAALGAHPFLRQVGGEELAALAGCAREVRYPEGAFIFREGDDADTLYLLQSGCVALEEHVPVRGAVTVESLCGGDILGLSWLFPPARWTLDARCTGEVEAFALRADCVRERIRANPQLAADLLGRVVEALYQRLVRVRLQRLDVYRAAD
jgi:CRP/FNR family transcriptional regulator, cyclic AMP receptor protein